MGLIRAIPTKYKDIFAKNIKYETQKKNIENIVQRKENVLKLIYETKIERNKHFPEKASQKIKTMFGIEISKELFLHYFTIAEAATTYNTLREFQYRILHSIVTMNITLKSWNIIDDDKCTFCQMEPENLKHLLLHCNYSKIIWDLVKQLIQDISEITVQLSETETILGISDSTELKIFNLVNMVIKQYIYACRCNKLLPSPTAAIEKKCIVKNLEYKLALKNDKNDQHNKKKWQLLHTIETVRGGNGWNYETLFTHLFHCPVWYSTYQNDISCNALLDHQQLEYMHVFKPNEKPI